MAFEIIDFHMHPFIEDKNNFCVYKENMKMDYKTTLSDMEDAGISKFCGSVIARGENLQSFDTIKAYNREALKLTKLYGDKYVPGFHVHPDFIEESINEIKFANENNVKIIGELVPYMHGWEDYSCREFSEILDEISKYNMIVSIHTLKHDQMEKMASEHKNIRFVFAHPGERESVEKHINIMKKHENVYLDLSGTGLFRYGVVRHLANSVGADRILFGTDYPIGNLAMYVNGVLGEKLTDAEKELIFSQNAKRLLFE